MPSYFGITALAWYLEPAAVGLYVTATSLSERVWELPHAIRTVLLQRVASDGNAASMQQLTAQVCRIVMFLTGILCAALVVMRTHLMTLLFGETFAASGLILGALMPGTWLLGGSKLLAVHLAASDRPWVGTVSALVSLFLTVVLDVLLIPRYGPLGAAVASSAAYAVASAILAVVFLRMSGQSLRDILIIKRSDFDDIAKMVTGLGRA